MTTITENEIRCEMTLKASVDKVWDALTTAEGWTGWFSYGVKGEFAEGNMLERISRAHEIHGTGLNRH